MATTTPIELTHLETFDFYPDTVIPTEGGFIDFNGFIFSADGNHASDNPGDTAHCPGVLANALCGDIHRDLPNGPDGPLGRPTFNRIEFDLPVSSFGFDLDAGGGETPIGLIFAPGGPTFWVTGPRVGFETETSFTRFDIIGDTLSFSIDNLQWVDAPTHTPEPNTGLLLALGLALISWLGRRRRLTHASF